ncbi:Homocysteine S-methyltransferase [Oopsacas minuta]|uniref:Homocysteine S-methyltransferase n=1 Tax=Oopsacas minuta TaxID=111878 RepID=A0AAV7JZ02_9METZ|nr:Homocysteine S-methyltransferase [Oopsacas minuta]
MSKCGDIPSENVDADKTTGKKRKFCTDEDMSDHEDEVEKVESSRKKAKIESFVTVLDGGMGRELDVNYPDLDFKDIWSAAHLLNQPGSVYHAHLSFISAGAEVITTSNYACVPAFLAKMDITDKMYDLIKVSGEQAQKAKISFENSSSIRVAGSIPPYGFSYMGMKIPDNSEIISSYAKIAIHTLTNFYARLCLALTRL